MNRGVEIAAEVADRPNVADHRPGAQRRGRAHGGAVPAAGLGHRGCSADPSRTAGPAAQTQAEDSSIRRAAGLVDRQGRAASTGRAIVAPTALSSRPIGRSGRPRRRRPCSTPAGCVVAPGLVDLHTHLRQPGQRGGRDGRDGQPGRRARRLHRGGGHAQHRPRPSTRAAVVARGASTWAAARCATCAVGGHHRRPGRRAAGAAWPRWPSPGVRALHRRRHRRAGRPPHAPGPRVRQRPAASPWPSTARSTRSPPGGHMHEGEWSSRLGLPGQPGRGRGADGDPRHRPGPPHRRPRPLPAPVHRRVGRAWCGRPRPTGWPSPPRPRPTTSRSPTPSCAGYDPVFKVNPPLRTDADVAAVEAGLADGTIDAIATDHAPHTPGGQGAPVRPGAAGHARAGDGAGPGPHRARTCPIERSCWPCCRGSRRPSPAWPTAHGRPGRARRAPANLCVIDPTATWTVDPAASASRSRNTPYAGRTLTGRVRHTLVARRARRRRRRGPAMSERGITVTSAACSCWPTARCSRARPSGAEPDGVGHRRGRVQHRPDRLPGGHHRPVLRRPDHHLHLPAHRQLRRHRRRRRGAAAVLPRA